MKPSCHGTLTESIWILTYRLDLLDLLDMRDVRMAVFHFFQLSCDMNHTVHIRGTNYAVHTKGHNELAILALLVVVF